jgi:hypothetical protein
MGVSGIEQLGNIPPGKIVGVPETGCYYLKWRHNYLEELQLSSIYYYFDLVNHKNELFLDNIECFKCFCTSYTHDNFFNKDYEIFDGIIWKLGDVIICDKGTLIFIGEGKFFGLHSKQFYDSDIEKGYHVKDLRINFCVV